MPFAFSFSLRCGGKFRCKFIIVRVHLKFMNSSTAQYKEMLIQLKLSAPVPPSLQSSPLPLDSLASQCHCDCVTILPVHRDDTTKLHACLMMWAGTTTLVSPLLDDDATTWSGNVPCTLLYVHRWRSLLRYRYIYYYLATALDGFGFLSRRQECRRWWFLVETRSDQRNLLVQCSA